MKHFRHFSKDCIGDGKDNFAGAREFQESKWMAAPKVQTGNVNVRVGSDANHLALAGVVFAADLFHEPRNVSFGNAISVRPPLALIHWPLPALVVLVPFECLGKDFGYTTPFGLSRLFYFGE